jgi:hypothetical protein
MSGEIPRGGRGIGGPFGTMTNEDGSLYAEWDTTYEKLQFWLGVYRKALDDANGDETHHKVQFARTKLDAAQARYDAVVSRL